MLDPTPTPAPPVSARRFNPRRAAYLSLIPGLGQLANGQPKKAAAFLGGVIVLFALSFSVPGLTTDLVGFWRPRGSLMVSLSVILELVSLLVFIALFMAALAFWYASIHDARLTALERNAGTPIRGRWWLFRR
jgi:arabinogalactan oligomer/maltooligosaccharide transport system permease protein